MAKAKRVPVIEKINSSAKDVYDKILKKQKLAEATYMMQIQAPEVAKRILPGEFVILRIDESGERIPLSLADNDKKSITVVFLETGYTTKKLAKLKRMKKSKIMKFQNPI